MRPLKDITVTVYVNEASPMSYAVCIFIHVYYIPVKGCQSAIDLLIFILHKPMGIIMCICHIAHHILHHMY